MVALFISAGNAYAEAGNPPVAGPASPSVSPSRYVTGENFAAHMASVVSVLAMHNRATDPFGQHQDTNYRPPAPEIGQPDAPDQGGIPQVTLSDVISGIQVSMVMPQKQTFFVGDRAFHRGDRFPLRLGSGEMMNVEVLSITATAITFRETTKGQVAVLRLGGPPAGMQRGTTLGMPPGITVPNPAAPLDLQPSEAPQNSQSR